jgi:hypothetical protein
MTCDFAGLGEISIHQTASEADGGNPLPNRQIEKSVQGMEQVLTAMRDGVTF